MDFGTNYLMILGARRVPCRKSAVFHPLVGPTIDAKNQENTRKRSHDNRSLPTKRVILGPMIADPKFNLDSRDE